MQIIQTRSDGSAGKTTESEAIFTVDTKNQELYIINLYPKETFQSLIGFGGAFTEAAGYVYSKVSRDIQHQIMRDYFSEDGLNYVLGRCPIDSCDFALENYSAVTDPQDKELEGFSLKRDAQYIFPLLNDAKKVKNDISLILSPWSPPAFMKSNGEKNNGGYLLPEYYRTWAKYICKYIQSYKDYGYQVFAVSVQNEPNAQQRWDSCLYTPEQEKDFVRDHLGVALSEEGLNNIRIIIWDHNKERLFDRTDEICSDTKANQYVGAVGFHWYSGDHFEAIELLHRKYPDKLLLFTEGCIEYSKFSANSQLKNAQMYAHEIIGNVNSGMSAFIDWNLFLDKKGGPNHAGNFCDAPIMLDYENGKVIHNLSYYYIRHFSRYIKPGAVRIGYSRYTSQLEVTAFKNPDGNIVAVIFNPTENSYNSFVRLEGRLCPVKTEANTITTLLIDENE